MDAHVILQRLQDLGLRLQVSDGRIVARPRSALTDETRNLIRTHKTELLAELERKEQAYIRKARAFVYLDEHPDVKRVCFCDIESDPRHVILTVATREPFRAVEVLVGRERFDPLALIELSLRHRDTALQTLEH